MKKVLTTLATAALGLALLATPAQAAFGLKDLDVAITDSEGAPALQAGSHPFAVRTEFNLNTTGGVPDGAIKDFVADLPAGFAGDRDATPHCSAADFLVVLKPGGGSLCPDSTAIGYIDVRSLGGESNFAPVYNLTPAPGVPAAIGFHAASIVAVTVSLGLREGGEHNLFARVENGSQVEPVSGAQLTLWGVPADPAHDELRGSCLKGNGESLGSCSVDSPLRALITLPTRCTGPLAFVFKADSWQEPGVFDEPPPVLTHNGPEPLGTLGCDKLGFGPEITAQPTNHSAESPSGLDFDLNVDDKGFQSATVPAKSDIKKAVVTLPEGMTINPSQAEGLGACSEAEFESENIATGPGEGCPSTAKVGTLQVESPMAAGEVLEGSIYVAKPYENPFGTLIAIYLVFRDPELGAFVAIAGKVEPDPQDGQLITTFDDLPQLPISHFHLHFREGGRSPLITPPSCGSYTVQALFTPWAEPSHPFPAGSSFQIDSGCPAGGTPPFHPGFEAGSQNNAAGRYSPFAMRWTRRDGDQDITRFSAALPPGLIARLAGTAQCSDAAIAAAKTKSGIQEQAAPSCPAGSEIGDVIAAAGVGSELLYVPGKVYLAGPYKGAPISAVGIVPAVAGPFDVGTVVTRQALRIDPRTGEASADGSSSDPIPHILAGIPLKVRDIRVFVDRPEFTLNPTSCERFGVGATLWGGGLDVFSSLDDTPASLKAPFQAAGCASLGFKPNLALTLRGGTRRGAFPALHLLYKPRPGDANLRRLELRFPHSEFIEQGHFRTICTRVQYAAGAGAGSECPPGSVYGHVRVYTPLLDEPLSGPVFLRSSSHNLPDVVLALHGPPSLPIDFEVPSRIDSINGGLRAIASDTPDVPVGMVVLDMQGGQKGLFVNSTDICAQKHRATVALEGQNGDRLQTRPLLRAQSCGAQKRRGQRGRG